MNCANHLDRSANGLCSECSKALCADCLNAVRPAGYCADCLLNHNAAVRRDVVGGLAKSLALGVAFAIYAIHVSGGGFLATLGTAASALYFGITIYWGRRTVQRVTRGWGRVALIGGAFVSDTPGVALLIGFGVGLIAWIFVGIVAGPIEIGLAVRRFIVLGRGSRQLAAVRSISLAA